MMEGLKKRTRKAFGIRKKEKDNDSTGSPDRDSGSQKKTNGAPNGFYGDIDWDRYNSPEVDDEGYSIRPDEESEEGTVTIKKPHFFSSDESEGEEDQRKKFKIKIKPLPADQVATAPSVDVLKASIGNIALSPSPMRRSPGLKRNTSSEEIARPRRIVPTLPTVAPTPAPAPQLPSSQQTPASVDTTALFGPPLETAFGEPKTEVGLSESDPWGAPLSEPESPLTRIFPTGTPPPLPPKNVPTSPPSPGPSSAEVSTEADGSTRKLSIADLDNIFGPEQPPSAGEDTGDTWVCFSAETTERPPLPEEPAPPPPGAPPLPTSPPPPEDPAPPLPTSPPPKEEAVPPLPTSPTSSEELAGPHVPSDPPSPEDPNPPTTATSPPPAPPKELVSPPASSPPPTDSPAILPPAPAPKASTPPAVTPPAEGPPKCSPPPPLVLSQEEESKNSDVTQPKEDGGITVTSPNDANQGSRSTPPPPPPPTYRAVVSSPGPTSGGTNSGSTSPVRPATPSSVNTAPPPPPPRPPSRPKLPPGKPSVGDANRPFSPPVHSASPPPIAPLARAESTSSISSTNSLSAATTPVGKELSVSVSGV